jgi:hypothetical protein
VLEGFKQDQEIALAMLTDKLKQARRTRGAQRMHRLCNCTWCVCVCVFVCVLPVVRARVLYGRARMGLACCMQLRCIVRMQCFNANLKATQHASICGSSMLTQACVRVRMLALAPGAPGERAAAARGGALQAAHRQRDARLCEQRLPWISAARSHPHLVGS